MGTSGSEKSTLMDIIGLLGKYDEGEYYLDGKLMKSLFLDKAASYRNKYVEFVFQTANLMLIKMLRRMLYYLYIIKELKRRNEIRRLWALSD